jgi:hypothetical protein
MHVQLDLSSFRSQVRRAPSNMCLPQPLLCALRHSSSLSHLIAADAAMCGCSTVVAALLSSSTPTAAGAAASAVSEVVGPPTTHSSTTPRGACQRVAAEPSFFSVFRHFTPRGRNVPRHPGGVRFVVVAYLRVVVPRAVGLRAGSRLSCSGAPRAPRMNRACARCMCMCPLPSLLAVAAVAHSTKRSSTLKSPPGLPPFCGGSPGGDFALCGIDPRAPLIGVQCGGAPGSLAWLNI